MVKAIMFSRIYFIFVSDGTDSEPENAGINMFDNLIANGISNKIFRPDVENTSWMIVSAMRSFVRRSISNKLYLHDNFDQFVDAFSEQVAEYLTANFPPTLLKSADVTKDFGGEARVDKMKFIDKSIMKATMKGNFEKLKNSHETMNGFIKEITK